MDASSYDNHVLIHILLTYLKFYLTTRTLAIHNIFVKIQWVDFQMGRVILTNYLNLHPSLGSLYLPMWMVRCRHGRGFVLELELLGFRSDSREPY